MNLLQFQELQVGGRIRYTFPDEPPNVTVEYILSPKNAMLPMEADSGISRIVS